jgi:hypothetical protein
MEESLPGAMTIQYISEFFCSYMGHSLFMFVAGFSFGQNRHNILSSNRKQNNSFSTGKANFEKTLYRLKEYIKIL